MHLGIHADSGRVRYCLASATLGAGPGSWSAFNHRCWDVPGWLLFRLKAGATGVQDVEQVLVGSKAIEACSRDSFARESEDGEAVVWPWFSRDVERNPGAFTGVLEHYWNSEIARITSNHPRCRQVNVSAPLSKLVRVSEALERPDGDLRVRVLPDYYCALRSLGTEVQSAHRFLFADPGDDAFRLTLFRVHRDGDEEWVRVEDYDEIVDLGLLSILGAPIAAEAERRGQENGLAQWRALEVKIAEWASRPAPLPAELSEVRHAMGKRLRSFLERAQGEARPVDHVLVRDGFPWPEADAIGFPASRISPYGIAMGAAVFGQLKSESAHFVVPGSLYLSVDGAPGEMLVDHESFLASGTAGKEYAREVHRGSADQIDFVLLWGMGAKAEGFHPLARVTRRLTAPSSFVVGGVSTYRAGNQAYGALWVADPDAESLPSERWSLDLERWAYWTVR